SLTGEETSDPTVRSRRPTRMPKYLDEYEVEQAPDQQSVHTPSHHSNEGEQILGATGSRSPPHGTQVAYIDRSSAHEEKAHFNPVALQQRLIDLEKENSQLRCDLREHSTAHSTSSASWHCDEGLKPGRKTHEKCGYGFSRVVEEMSVTMSENDFCS
ncbi:hypothetical protein IRJ41_022744, partial [Triplophysa rosa]